MIISPEAVCRAVVLHKAARQRDSLKTIKFQELDSLHTSPILKVRILRFMLTYLCCRWILGFHFNIRSPPQRRLGLRNKLDIPLQSLTTDSAGRRVCSKADIRII